MIGTKELCAILLAGSMGAGSVVAVQKVKPISAKAKTRPRVERAVAGPSRSRVGRVETPQPPAPRILDCPAGSPVAAEPNQFVLPNSPTQEFGGNIPGVSPVPPVVWGGGGGHRPPPPSFPAVPEPGAWVMMIAGFGFVGLACRRRKASA